MTNHPLLILLAVRDESERLLLQETFQRAGHEVRVLLSSDEDLQLASRNDNVLHVFVTDDDLPETSVDKLRLPSQHQVPKLAVLLITDEQPQQTAHHAIGARAVIRLARPLDSAKTFSALEDLIEHQQTLADLTLAMDAAYHGMALVNAAGEIVLANSHMDSIFDFAEGELIGETIDDLVPDPLREDHKYLREAYFKNPVVRMLGTGRDLKGQSKSGKDVSVEVGLTPVDTPAGLHVLCSVVDITERKQLEAWRETEIELKLARAIQQDLLPKSAPDLPGLDIAGAAFPAEATCGDYFDYFQWRDGSIGLAIGDVVGHGLGPALLMAVTRTYLRALAHIYVDAEPLMNQINRLLVHDTSEERFVSMFLGRLDPVTRIFTYASAGQPGYLIDVHNRVEFLEATGTVLGILPDSYISGGPPVWLQPGALVLLFTDGISEAFSPTGEMFGNQRMLDIVLANRNRSANEIVHSLYESVCDFMGDGRQSDDITAVVIKVNDDPEDEPAV